MSPYLSMLTLTINNNEEDDRKKNVKRYLKKSWQRKWNKMIKQAQKKINISNHRNGRAEKKKLFEVIFLVFLYFHSFCCLLAFSYCCCCTRLETRLYVICCCCCCFLLLYTIHMVYLMLYACNTRIALTHSSYSICFIPSLERTQLYA